jgi:Zn-dependent metalloprotease
MTRHALQLSLIAASVSFACAAQAANLSGQSDAITRLSIQAGAAPQVSFDKATGAARFVRVEAPAGRRLSLERGMASNAAKQTGSARFLADYADLFGIKDVANELGSARVDKDRHGGTHLTYKQFHRGVPVFGGELKTHFDATDNLTVVNGSFVPGIDVGTSPSRSADEAALVAVARAKAELAEKLPAASVARVTASKPVLMIYREGLAQGVAGASRLVWQVEVGNRVDARDFFFIDANNLKTVDKISGIHEAKNRRAFNANNATAPGPNYPNSPFWVEGQAFPTGTIEADNMLAASSDIYDLFTIAFGRDSFNGTGGTMDSIFNRGNACPNASWNGTFISFCPGLTTDDVTAHEWAHAYTEYTHGLIYAWQSGALNEAYSDIWGETVDRLNNRGTDTPDAMRTPGSCSAFTTSTQVTITAPTALAASLITGTAAFGPQTFSVAANDVVVVNDGVGVGNDACTTPFVNAAAVAGKIAFVDRGSCSFDVKTKNAQLNGAIGVIVGNNAAGVINMGVSDPNLGVTIPALSVLQVDGTAIKAATGVRASLQRGPGSDNSVRWLLGEDSTAVGLTGALRDMYNPTCLGDPGKVSDKQYSCGPNTQAGDNGGVHINSGIPNHAFALLVDGGSYNGQVVGSIGLTKAAHIYWRAQSVYQGPTSDFAAHADALEQSCRDLTGAALADLKTGLASGQVITASDCGEIAKALLAVEMRSPPTQCNFATLLAKAPPALCPSGTQSMLASDGFDGGKKGGIKWAVTHTGPVNYEARDWAVVSGLPSSRAGYAMHAPNRNIGTCGAGGDATNLQRLESAAITVPAGTTTLRMAFDHLVATEAGYDGGNLKISVNGGAWQLVRAADFVYNPYNATLITAAGGNSNPLAGQGAFSGTDAGSNSGSWGRSIINLAPYAVAGDSIKLRFELGSDCGSGVLGWYVDDVQVYRCVTPQ